MSARGDYGPAHTALRRRWATVVASGTAVCARCHLHIAPGAKWCLDHTDDRADYLGPSHEACNAAAANRNHTNHPAYRDPPARSNGRW